MTTDGALAFRTATVSPVFGANFLPGIVLLYLELDWFVPRLFWGQTVQSTQQYLELDWFVPNTGLRRKKTLSNKKKMSLNKDSENSMNNNNENQNTQQQEHLVLDSGAYILEANHTTRMTVTDRPDKGGGTEPASKRYIKT